MLGLIGSTNTAYMTIRMLDATPDQLATVANMNNSAGPTIFNVEIGLFEYFQRHADYFRIAMVDDQPAGFLIALMPGHDYGSPNYRYFCQRFQSFLYIDRVVVDKRFRGSGVGKVIYADLLSFAEQRAERLTCEVSIEPKDEVAMLFHGTLGFREVGQQVVAERNIRVALLAQELPAFEFVKQRYGAAA
jgi:uncharacterized protein